MVPIYYITEQRNAVGNLLKIQEEKKKNNNLEILVNRKIQEYQDTEYLSNEEKEKIVDSLTEFLEENKLTYEQDLEEINRLKEDIENFEKEKRRLEYKYEIYIDITELCQMKQKRDNN